MSVQTKTAKTDDQKLQSRLPSVGTQVKEQEPARGKTEDELMVEITTRADALDREHEAKVRELIAEVRRTVPEPAVPPDVEDAGVVSPQLAAEDVVKKGTILDLPVAESVYKKGLQTKLRGKVVGTVGNKLVVGVSSLVALAMWIGRLVKMAHGHAMKVIFRKEAN